MSMYMPSCGSLFTAARVMFPFACTLVVLLEQSEFFSFLSYQGSKGNGLGFCPLVRLEIAYLLKFFRMRSCLFSLTHPKVNFLDGPHQRGPILFSFASSCRPNSKLS